jgi:hypothetical protein
MAASPQPEQTGVRRLAMAGAALTFGAFGWLLAHALTYLVVEHVDPNGVRHVHGGLLARLTVIAGGLGVASLMALIVVAMVAPHAGAALRRSSRLSARRSSNLAVAAFVVSEFAEHGLSGDRTVPPLLVLVVGCVLQALVGAGTAVLWRECVDGIRRLVSTSGTGKLDLGEACFVPVWFAGPRRRRNRWSTVIAGRAPPAVLA